PKDVEESGWNFKDIVFPNHPYRLDFVMLPAASVTIELVDAEGKPLADYELCLKGDELYPASSVLECETTDAHGAATFADVPLKSYWFSLRAGRAEYKTEPVEFREAKQLRYRLIYDDVAGVLKAEVR
ncbi:MAG TPA: hypothetical protein VF175_03650, partial [Lacipirellula sp.]